MNFKESSQAVEKAVTMIKQEFKLLDRELCSMKTERNQTSLRLDHLKREVKKLTTSTKAQKFRIIKGIAKEFNIDPQHLINIAGLKYEFQE